MLQARRLGTSLLVGIHSDDAILANKGPTVMSLPERVAAVDACRWSTRSIPSAPYVTSLAWISHYGCRDVVHGDDITSDASGEDCYRFVKDAGRFKVVKRTPGISTTDLVGRMLLCTRGHFVRSLKDVLEGREGKGDEVERVARGNEMKARIRDYATDETGLANGVQVWSYTGNGRYEKLFEPEVQTAPKPKQRLVYVDGGFDLFSPGHIAFLESVVVAEQKVAAESGWDEGYASFYLVAGIHNDSVVNEHKGLNYPIMNIFERGLCVLQCKYVNAVVFGTPYAPDTDLLVASPWATRGDTPCWDAIYHGPAGKDEAYAYAKETGVFRRVGEHAFQDVNANTIVQRIMASRALYEERQRKKGEKATVEELEKEQQAKARLNAES